MSESILVHNLKKNYGEHVALKGIDLRVEQGEIFAFLGPNGAGKSTMISILSTLVPYDSGEVRIEGYLLGKQDEWIRHQIGIVFQGSSLDEALSVYQNLKIRCGLYQLFGKQCKQRIHELSELCQLQDILHQSIQTLSGGQRRRVDIARALIPKPKLIILDEPSTGLDPKYRKELWTMIQHLHQQEHMTIFLTTHYMEEAEIADHICMIHQGSILLDGKREELISSFQKDRLQLYTKSKQQVGDVLNRKKIKYQWMQDYVEIEVSNFYEIMSILRSCEHYIYQMKLQKGSIEDMYLQVLEGKIA